MALRFGNDYLVFVATALAPTVFSLLGGQQGGTFGDTRADIDASHKTSGGFDLSISANRKLNINLTFIAELPDAGFTIIQNAYNGNLGVVVQIRDKGAASVVGDAVFTCLMGQFERNIELPLNGVVSGSLQFKPLAAPSLDLIID